MKSEKKLPGGMVKLAAVCVGLACLTNAAQALTIVDTALKDEADRTDLVFTFDEPLSSKLPMFRMTSPERQVLNFPVRLGNPNWTLGLTPDSRVTLAQMIHTHDKTRLILGMQSAYQVTQSVDANRLTLSFSGPRPFLPTSTQAARLTKDSPLAADIPKPLSKAVPINSGPRLLNIEAVQSGQSEVLKLNFNAPNLYADARLDNDRLTVRFANVVSEDEVIKSLNAQAFKLAKNVTLSSGDQALMLRLNLSDASHQIRQIGNSIELAFSPRALTPEVFGASNSTPVEPLSPSQSSVARYAGRPISLDFKNADIRTVMQVFADFTKMNLVLSENVQGKVTVFLKDVPWDQALEIVMRSKGLVSSQSGNVLLVSTPEDLAGTQLESAKRSAQDGLEPLVSRVFLISYQKTADLVALIKANDAGLLSARGSLIADERTSQIFVRDTPSRLDRIASIVTGLDKPVKQVMIEARVVLADTSVSKELGVRLRGASARSDAFADIGDQFGSGNFVDTGPDATANFAYTLFNANSTRLINMQLRALETSNRIRTVSNPRVITSNKEAASIEQGTEIPYQIATSSGATAIEFKEANLKLEVTPQITPDGTVLLQVDVAKDSVGITTAAGPAIDTRRVKTKVLVADGGTVVLGGIFEEDDNIRDDKIPFLGDVPVLGHLFKGKTDNRRRAELLIFLTPVVLSGL
ncbi:MAG TPA: type IV pilus secretin PilQ [Limnobacter sp.]|nr:type IV pilus secretin PilQ [Limnobacter sp.]